MHRRRRVLHNSFARVFFESLFGFMLRSLLVFLVFQDPRLASLRFIKKCFSSCLLRGSNFLINGSRVCSVSRVINYTGRYWLYLSHLCCPGQIHSFDLYVSFPWLYATNPVHHHLLNWIFFRNWQEWRWSEDDCICKVSWFGYDLNCSYATLMCASGGSVGGKLK